jgi:hypothetical protein
VNSILQTLRGHPGQGEKGRSGIAQTSPAALGPTEIGNGLAFIVIVGPEQDQLALHDILCVKPNLEEGAVARLDTMPSRPMAQACLNSAAPSASKWSLN